MGKEKFAKMVWRKDGSFGVVPPVNYDDDYGPRKPLEKGSVVLKICNKIRTSYPYLTQDQLQKLFPNHTIGNKLWSLRDREWIIDVQRPGKRQAWKYVNEEDRSKEFAKRRAAKRNGKTKNI